MSAADELSRRDQQVVREVVGEMGAQVKKWGEQQHPDLYAPATPYAVARVQHITDQQALVGRVTWQQILDEEMIEACGAEDLEALHDELIQVAAVALSWARDIIRRGSDGDILILPPADGAVT